VTEIEYNVAIETNSGSILVDWGNSKDWVTKYREDLDNANSLALIPKEGIGLPIVTVELSGQKRWVVFSKVFGIINKKNNKKSEIRLYCIGWQQKVAGTNVKSLNWVYPGGTVENSENPSFVGKILKAQ